MAFRDNIFRVFYGLGVTPWAGHVETGSLRELVEGTAETPALPPGAALDVGCGTGDSSIYLGRHGWHVTGVDFEPKALGKARAKARAAGVPVDFVQADITHLSRAGINAKFQLIVDNGCLHGMTDHDRDLYVREITAAAAPDARLLIVANPPRVGLFSYLRLGQAEVERRFTPAWTLRSTAKDRWAFPDDSTSGHAPITSLRDRSEVRCYLLERAG